VIRPCTATLFVRLAHWGTAVEKITSNVTDPISASLEHLRRTPLRRIAADQARVVERRVLSGTGTTTTVDVAAFSSSI